MLHYLPLPLLQLTSDQRILPFFYHLVGESDLAHIKHLYSYKTATAFELDLQYLQQRSTVIDHQQLLKYRLTSQQPASLCTNISFDDGLSQCFTLARPLLLKYNIPCSFFVCKNFIDNKVLMHKHAVSLCIDKLYSLSDEQRADLSNLFNREFELKLKLNCDQTGLIHYLKGLTYRKKKQIDRMCELLNIDINAYLSQMQPYMSSAQIIQLHKDGFIIGAHSCNHPELWLLGSWEDIEEEIVQSCDAVRELTGQEQVSFAIPFNGLELRREDLISLSTRYKYIDLIYDTNNLMRDHPFIVNRIWCDTMAGVSEQQSNIPSLIKRAYALEPLRRLKRNVQKRPH